MTDHDPCRRFPVLLDHRTRHHPECPREIPWSLIAPFEAIVERDYRQDLETVARRGGFTPVELFKVFRREHLRDNPAGEPVTTDEAVAFLLGLMSGHAR